MALFTFSSVRLVKSEKGLLFEDCSCGVLTGVGLGVRELKIKTKKRIMIEIETAVRRNLLVKRRLVSCCSIRFSIQTN